jgi:hypothetical protein
MVLFYGFTAVEVLATVLSATTALVGLYIASLAYRGLERYRSRAMLYLAAGMILLFGVTYVAAAVGTLLLRLRVLSLPAQDIFRLAIRVLQLGGVALIAYSLHVRSDGDDGDGG